MFPVPSHLPRSGGEHISSQAEAEVNAQGNQPPVEAQSEQEQSKVLDLLEPLLRLPLNNDDKQNKEHKRNVTRWNVDEIRKVKKNLENAIEENKVRLVAFPNQDQQELICFNDDGRLKPMKS